MAWFFLSYAREDDDDEYIGNFFEDLSKTIRKKMGLPKDEPSGFRDNSNLVPGDEWREELASELNICKIFVPLYSPTYLRKEFCGKEFQFFWMRHSRGMQSHILPVTWIPMGEDLPQVIGDTQYTHGSYPKVYKDHGLRYVMARKANKDDYEEFLEAFSDLAVAAAKAELPPLSEIPEWEKIANPFIVKRKREAPVPIPPPPPPRPFPWLMVVVIGLLLSAFGAWFFIPVSTSGTEFHDSPLMTPDHKPDKVKWTAPAEWDVVLVKGDADFPPGPAIRVVGPKLGVIRSEDQQPYGNCKFLFRVRFNHGKTVAWAVRVQLSGDNSPPPTLAQLTGYLFQLESQQTGIYLKGDVYRKGAGSHLLSEHGQESPVFPAQFDENDPFDVTVAMDKDIFQHTITHIYQNSPSPPVTRKEKLWPPPGLLPYFHAGSSGFLETVGGSGVTIQNIDVLLK